MKILKFGGSSVGTVESLDSVCSIIRREREEGAKAVVVSAFQGVTDSLFRAAKDSAAGDTAYKDILDTLEKRHIQAIKKSISVQQQSEGLAKFKLTFNELDDVLHGVYLVRELTPRTLDFILGFGERFSAYILSEMLNDRQIEAEYVDARQLIKTDAKFGSAHVLAGDTYERIKAHFKDNSKLQIVTGFVASTHNDESTTLGRGGSDYTASLLGASLRADLVEIWTDVDGLMTADPGKVKRAFPISSLTYEEAMELSHFGAKVIYPPTLQPAMKARIPIQIRNTFRPEAGGTRITRKSQPGVAELIKGMSSIDDIVLITVRGSGMIGVSGVAARICKTLADASINIIMITQASSEHTVCVAVLPDFADEAKSRLEHEFRLERQEEGVDEIVLERDLSIIAVVGDGMRHKPGISGRVFNALGRNGVNIVAIAQGSSERNISFVVKKKDESKALNTLHDAFFLSGVKTVNLFLVGVGLIGGRLLELIQKQAKILYDNYLIDLRLVGVANSRKMLMEEQGIPLEEWSEALAGAGKKTDLQGFVNMIKQLNLPNSVFIDCTASEEVTEIYDTILEASVSVVTPNKIANSGSQEQYEMLRGKAVYHNAAFRYETNVGAGLPIVATIHELTATGDRVQKIRGVLSGTLSYLFNSYDGDIPFSELVRQARQKGYTEPDPREDLNGHDVGRKLLILAREAGYEMEFNDLDIQNLVPEQARDASDMDDFFQKLARSDDDFERLRTEAEKQGKKLCYIAEFEKDDGKGKIGLEQIGPGHPFYNLSGSDNIVALNTEHYRESPMVVKGPGAGADVTAGGIIADILRVVNTTAQSNAG